MTVYLDPNEVKAFLECPGALSTALTAMRHGGTVNGARCVPFASPNPALDPVLAGLLLHALETGDARAVVDWWLERNDAPGPTTLPETYHLSDEGEIVEGFPPDRCQVCGWTLARDAESGCVPGNCCYRPDERSPEGTRIRNRRAELARRRTP